MEVFNTNIINQSNHYLDTMLIPESIKKVTVIRDLKKVKKYTTDKVGFRIEIDSKSKMPKEVLIKPDEKKNRKVGQKIGKLKRSAKSDFIQKKRLHSFKIRKQLNLKYKADPKTIDRINKKIGELPKGE
jgi:hypothetical protein